MAASGFFAFLASASIVFAAAALKECTNIPTQSHSIRARLATTTDAAWRANMMSYVHLNPTDESAWMDLHPRKLSNTNASVEDELDWLLLYRSMSGSAGDVREGVTFLSDVPLQDVRLEPGSAHWRAQQTNLEYLLLLDVDSLVWSFRRLAGLPAPGKPYGGWESPDTELRGHFVGHYMSATAMMWASTGNGTVYDKMSAVVDALHACQQQIGTGYLSAFPPEFFDRFEQVQPVWAPYYTIHKIMAGLLDQYTFSGNAKALQMAVAMANYFGDRVKNVIKKYTIERHWRSLNEETGGMNDVLYRLYRVTRNQEHLTLAHLFDKPCFLGYLAVKADSLSGFHSNTHIPVVIGAQMRYEVTGDALYKDIVAFFMDTVNSSHAYATGGTSVDEFWSDPKRLADTLGTENEESCTTYNMLKVSRNLFRWTKEMAYADYYERALTNGVLSIQRGTDPGVMIYMLPQGPGTSKAVTYHGWGTLYNSFWCCYGTAIESFSKLGDSIYFEEARASPTLYVIQFIPSSFKWRSAGVTVSLRVNQVSSSDAYLTIVLGISAVEPAARSSTLYVRIPSWTSQDGAVAALNGKNLAMPSPGNFLAVTQPWSSGDALTLRLPIKLRTERIKDDRHEYAALQAILFGPYLLAGLSSGDWDAKSGDHANAVSEWITPVPASYNSQLLTFTQYSGGGSTVLSWLNDTLAMAQWPRDGTDAAVHATFRVFSADSRRVAMPSRRRLMASPVMIEPLDLPGMVVTNSLTVSTPGSDGSWFVMAPGLNGEPRAVSLELRSKPGCYAAGGQKVRVWCKADGDAGGTMKEAASFVPVAGVRRYHPLSFAARGVKRNFLLEPLMSLRDEFYTIYFNVGA